MSSNDHAELRHRIVEGANRLIRNGALSRNNHGNMSIRIPGTDEIIMTGSSLQGLSPEGLARINLAGEVLDGRVDPASNEIIEMHTAVYRSRPDVGSVVHTHSPHATAYAIAAKPMECFSSSLARLGIINPIPVTKFGPRGSDLAVRSIEETLHANPDCKALLLGNHGILTFDAAVEQATHFVFAMEENAEVSILASLIGQPKVISTELIRAAAARRQEFEQLGTVAR